MDMLLSVDAGTTPEAVLQMRASAQARALEGRPARRQAATVAREAKKRKKDIQAVFISPRKGQAFQASSPNICCSQRRCSEVRGCVPHDM